MRIKEVVQHKPHLFLDMDGVQADFFTAWARLFGKEQYKDIGDRAQREVSIADINSRGPEFVEAFFTNLPVLPGAQTLIKFLRDNKIDYTILSAPLRGNEEASIRGKLAWLDRHHPGSSATAIFTGEKQRYATTNGKPNVLVDDFKKYVNAWTADGGIAVLYRWNNVGSAIDQLRDIYGIDSEPPDPIQAIREAIIGTLYPKDIAATYKTGDMLIKISRHLIDRAEERDVDNYALDRTLRRLFRIKSKMRQQESGQKFWVYNPHDDISVGIMPLDSGAFLATTVIQGAPHAQGSRPIVRLYEESREENFAYDRKFVEPNFEFEWEEAERYPEFAKLGKDAWIELARKGRAVAINSARGISNTDAAEPDSFKSLDPAKQKRALAQLETGTVEMPIVAVYSDGRKELVGGNTRLTALMARDGQATVWAFRVPDNILENFADGKVKGKSRPGRVKRAGASCNGSVTSLRQRAKNASGEKAKMYHWCANMKSGRKK